MYAFVRIYKFIHALKQTNKNLWHS